MFEQVSRDIIKLTALFVARSGRRFQTDLAQREAANYQFEFLQPSHSLFPFFNRLVEQYTKVLIPDAARLARLDLHAGFDEEGRPDPLADEAERRAVGRRQVLKEVDNRVQWEKWDSEQRQKQEDEAERMRIAFQEIDWQDFVVVSTVEFTEADDMIELPPPRSLREVQNMSLREKRRAVMVSEGKEAELDEETILAQAEEAARQAMEEDGVEMDGTEMEVDGKTSAENEETRRKKVDEIKPAETGGAVKIKPQGYVPRCEYHLTGEY